MDLLDAGYAFEHISATYGIHAAHLKVLRSKYLQQGSVGLEKGKNIKADFELRKRIVLEVEKKHLPLHVASLKFGAAPQTICRWLKAYREEGLSALGESKSEAKYQVWVDLKRIAILSVSWNNFGKKTRNSRQRTLC